MHQQLLSLLLSFILVWTEWRADGLRALRTKPLSTFFHPTPARRWEGPPWVEPTKPSPNTQAVATSRTFWILVLYQDLSWSLYPSSPLVESWKRGLWIRVRVEGTWSIAKNNHLQLPSPWPPPATACRSIRPITWGKLTDVAPSGRYCCAFRSSKGVTYGLSKYSN